DYRGGARRSCCGDHAPVCAAVGGAADKLHPYTFGSRTQISGGPLPCQNEGNPALLMTSSKRGCLRRKSAFGSHNTRNGACNSSRASRAMRLKTNSGCLRAAPQRISVAASIYPSFAALVIALSASGTILRFEAACSVGPAQ